MQSTNSQAPPQAHLLQTKLTNQTPCNCAQAICHCHTLDPVIELRLQLAAANRRIAELEETNKVLRRTQSP